MIIVDHYIRLYRHFSGDTPGEKQELSVNQVSDILFCTDRNSKLILNRLEDQKWIEWVPGKGRGNRSAITFLVEPATLVFNQAKECVGKGKPREARNIIEEHATHFPFLKDQFDMWFQSQFGFRTAVKDQENQDTLRLKFGKLPVTPLDPKQISLRSVCHIVQHVCDTLVTFNKETRLIDPRLAFYWESTDQKKWTFYLRKGVRFHDGQQLTADDVVFTFERLFKNNNQYSWMVENIDEVRSLERYTVEFILKEPNYYFLYLLCDEHLSILSSNHENEAINTILIGTGPYKLIRNDESMLVMEAFDAYFGERPFLDRVEYWFVPETDGISLNNEVMWVGVYPHQRLDMEENHCQEQSILEWNVQFLSFNLRENRPLADPLFRKALKGILNPLALIQELSGDRGQVATGFLPQEDDRPLQQMDDSDSPESLLKDSKYWGETLHLYTFDDWDHHEDAEWIVERCKRYGITIVPTYLSDKDLLRKETMQKADIIHDSATMGDHFEVSFLHLVLADNSFILNHLTGDYSEKIKEMVKRFYGETSANKRFLILQDIQQLLLDLDVVIPLYRNEAFVNSDSMVQNVKVNTQGWIDLSHIWFKKCK